MTSLETKIPHFFTELLATHEPVSVAHAVIIDLAHRRAIGLDAFIRAVHYICIENEGFEDGWTTSDNKSHMAVINVPNDGNIEHCFGKWLEKHHGVIVIEPERDNDDGVEKAKAYLKTQDIQTFPKEWTEDSIKKLFDYLDLNGDIRDEVLGKEYHFELDFPIDLKIPSPIKAKSVKEAESFLNLQIASKLTQLNRILFAQNLGEIDARDVKIIWK